MIPGVETRNRAAYAGLTELLAAAGLGGHATHLNWGYRPVDGKPDWASAAFGEGTHERLVRELLAHVPLDGASILDVGCGLGGATALITRIARPLALFGVDLSQEHIDACRAHRANVRARFQVADACRLPHPSGMFDVVLNLESSGAYSDLPAFFRHACRVLAPRGRFLYGDVFARSVVDPVRDALVQSGFRFTRERNVTAQVLAARDAALPVARRLRAGMEHLAPDVRASLGADLDRYLAVPGSPMYLAMERGDVEYWLFQWTRAEGAAPSSGLAPAIAAALSERDTRLHAALSKR